MAKCCLNVLSTSAHPRDVSEVLIGSARRFQPSYAYLHDLGWGEILGLGQSAPSWAPRITEFKSLGVESEHPNCNQLLLETLTDNRLQMSPWTHRGKEMLGDVFNHVPLMSRGRNFPFLQPKAGMLWGPPLRQTPRRLSWKSLGVS